MSKEWNFFQAEFAFPSSRDQKPSPTTSNSIHEKPNLNVEISNEYHEQETSDDIEEIIQLDHQIQQTIKKVIEALLFTSSDPLPLSKIREITDTLYPLRPKQLRQIIDSLRQEFIAHQRAFKLEEIAQGYVLRTHEEYAPYLDILHRQKRTEKISCAATEVLAIVAYRQPITRPQIDAIRGVDSSGILSQLIERQLIEMVGKLEAPGRPSLYGTTKEFLKHYGLKDLGELEKIKS
ncbi:SMC-Scp complex subunit ScpB [Candidatus Protochlamydia sp. R18]|uniref:SMC-Scp complex subunit ScpB n=1 Tax=Candidatus Protochlamydia sp. R18 TaxID=1353977 RepID=UPI0006949ACE|nr:SMC-Scp complex subunit ScpB [Candidatus Protochlamydia sp. R18]